MEDGEVSGKVVEEKEGRTEKGVSGYERKGTYMSLIFFNKNKF